MKRFKVLMVAGFTGLALGFGGLALAQGNTDAGVLAEADQLDTGMGAELYFYITLPEVPFEEIVEVLPAHMDFVHTIEDGGIMVMGGQITPEGLADAGGRGLIVIRADSFEEARAIADRDPMHVSGVRRYDLYKWNVNEGVTNITLKFSDQSFVID
ncbi:MAG: YciI family protein [Pseudomonadota bacterium]